MFKISLSAGHGYNTSGKRSPDGMREWEFNSAVVKYMMSLLAEYENVAVQRLDDNTGQTDPSLQSRSDRANGWGANIHIDIHANAYGTTWNDVRGVETYVYKTTLKEAYDLARVVQDRITNATGMRSRGVKAADFHMLRETKMDAILIECGFMTNKEDLACLKSDGYRRTVAKAIVEGVASKYGLKKKVTPAPPPPPASNVKGYRVQVGYFSKREGAETLKELLKAKGFDAIIVEDK